MANWYDDALQLRDFADVLVAAEVVEDASLVLAKPYKFTTEFLAWRANGFPSEEDSEWDSFITDLSTEEVEDGE